MENKEANEKLMTAVIRGDIDMAIEALQSGASIHIKTTKGNNLLYVAASRMQEDMFDWLLEVEQGDKKIDLNTQNSMGATTLMDFILEDGFLKYTKKLLEAGANPNITTFDGMSPLIQACAYKKFDEVQLLLEHNVDVNYVIPDMKTTAFLMAAANGSMSICEVLKEHGADVGALNYTGKNALIQAVFQSQEFMKKREKAEHKALCFFLADIIDIDYVAPTGMTALWAASVNRNKELTQYFLEKGAKPEVWHEIGLDGQMSALHVWANSKEIDLVKMFLDGGARLDVPDAQGNTVAAIGFANPAMRQIMLDYNADVNSFYYMKKAHHGAEQVKVPVISLIIQGGNNQKDIVREMIDRGAKVTFDNELQAYEPIVFAIASSAYDIVNDLLNTKQIDVNKLVKGFHNGPSMTPLMLAVTDNLNSKFELFLQRKKQYEAIKKAKAENDKNGVKSNIIDDEGMQQIEQDLKQMEHIENQLKEQKIQILNALLASGSKVDVVNEDGNSAIFFASMKETAQWLKDNGANLYLENSDGNNALIYSVLNNKKDLIDFLKAEYVATNHATIDNIYYQLAFTDIEVYHQQELLEHGIFNYLSNEIDLEKFHNDKEGKEIFNVRGINYQDEDGNSPLLVACANNLPFLVSLYSRFGADINLKNNNDETPLMHAISTGNDRLVEFLVDKGADVNAQTKEGKTVLNFAEECGDKVILEKVKIALGHEVLEGSISGVRKIKPN